MLGTKPRSSVRVTSSLNYRVISLAPVFSKMYETRHKIHSLWCVCVRVCVCKHVCARTCVHMCKCIHPWLHMKTGRGHWMLPSIPFSWAFEQGSFLEPGANAGSLLETSKLLRSSCLCLSRSWGYEVLTGCECWDPNSSLCGCVASVLSN